jgi:hypothetical protein
MLTWLREVCQVATYRHAQSLMVFTVGGVQEISSLKRAYGLGLILEAWLHANILGLC